MLGRLSFRYKLPLALVTTAVLTAVVLSMVTLAYGYVNARDSLIDHAHELASVLVAPARTALRNDDIWAAYTMLRGDTSPALSPGRPATDIRMLVDTKARVVAANHPQHFTVGRALDEGGSDLSAVGTWLQREGLPQRPVQLGYEVVDDHLVLVTPVLSRERPIGAIVIAYPHSRLVAGFWQVAGQGVLAIAAVLAVLLPFGWYLGHRIASPLTQLTEKLARVGQDAPEQIDYSEAGSADEIGRLQTAFNAMLVDLQEKAALERQVIASERLAALGRLTATVAHEVNNPLGGMLVAVDTLRRAEPDNERVQRNAALLERGLEQIRQTVSALLVQGRPEDRPVSARDLDDVRMLASARLERRGARLEWESNVAEPIPLPATTVRQILINLLLNAVDAVEVSGDLVRCRITVAEEEIGLRVENNGPAIPPTCRDRIFEPFTTARAGGSGLGLWITYQLVVQLGGRIDLDSADGWTCFRVELPLHDAKGDARELETA